MPDLGAVRGPVAAQTASMLADQDAVCKLACIYALGMDLRDEDMVRSVFDPDGVIHGLMGAERAGDYVGRLIAGTRPYRATMHTIGNQHAVIEGDRATVWSDCIALGYDQRPERDGEVTEIVVRYEDEAARTELGWWITARHTVKLWTRGPERAP